MYDTGLEIYWNIFYIIHDLKLGCCFFRSVRTLFFYSFQFKKYFKRQSILKLKIIVTIYSLSVELYLVYCSLLGYIKIYLKTTNNFGAYTCYIWHGWLKTQKLHLYATEKKIVVVLGGYGSVIVVIVSKENELLFLWKRAKKWPQFRHFT